MYKEFRDLTRADAVKSCYQAMASLHRARFRSVQIIRVAEVKSSEVRRPYMKQLIDPQLKFPLPHRTARKFKPLFAGRRPVTI